MVISDQSMREVIFQALKTQLEEQGGCRLLPLQMDFNKLREGDARGLKTKCTEDEFDGAVQDISRDRKICQGSKYLLGVLMPRKSEVEEITKYRPISLMGIVYKILA